jgi:hypothetical protein
MELKLRLENGPEIGQKVKKNMDQLGQVVRESMQEAAHQIADEILFLGAEDIEEAGNFGDRWQEALHADIEETQRTITVNAYMKADEPPVMYWRVFEYGATIKAKNPSGLMWIPFAGSVFGSKAGGADVWPRAYSGSLFRAGNVLFDAKDEQARYFGTPEVHIPKKFHLTEIIKDQASKARVLFGAILKENRSH